MGQFVLIAALIAKLLVCPVFCCSTYACSTSDIQPTGSDLVAQSERHACSCCVSSQSSHGEVSFADSPVASFPVQDDCTCPDCICDGATIQEGPELPSVTVQLDRLPHDQLRHTIAAMVTLRLLDGDAVQSRHLSAKDVRVHLQRWLI